MEKFKNIILRLEMIEHFNKRTNLHIDLVKKFAKKLIENYPELKQLQKQINNHDQSKFKSPEYEPYLHINWMYKLKDEGKEYKVPSEIDDKMKLASFHHIKNNKHHPEYWDDSVKLETGLNSKDRDGIPDKMIDATNMDKLSLAEMVCDWCAMSKEKKNNTPIEWADTVINKRWKFNDGQIELIYNWINKIW